MVRKERAANGPPRTFRLYRVGTRARSAAKGTTSEREKRKTERALNCLHLINRTWWTITMGFAAAKDRHDHRCTSVGEEDPVALISLGHRVFHCHALDSRTIEMHPLMLRNPVLDPIGIDFFFSIKGHK